MKNILITGGAGYIGTHILRELSKQDNYNITVVDNLSKGFLEPIDLIKKESKSKINFIKLDLREIEEFNKLKRKRFDIVIHLASLIVVNESNKKPLEYFENNVLGSLNLFKYMIKTKSKRILFSSTASVYSTKAKLPFKEDSPVNPENPYSESKLMVENILKWFSKAYKFNVFILRYFNPCGASSDGKIGYDNRPATHLFPCIVKGALGISKFKLTCGKVNTKDGTTIRDYFNILDLVDAHKLAVESLVKGHKGGIYNIGMGKGHSVLDIINIVKEVTGIDFKIEKGEKREGEIPEMFSDIRKFSNEFKWRPKHTLKEAVENLIKWYKNKPNGYSY